MIVPRLELSSMDREIGVAGTGRFQADAGVET
jgi:hypothetical protein